MAKLGISTGTTPDDGTGTSLLIGAARINSNFDEIYDYFGTGTELSFAGGRWVETDVGINTLGSVGIGTTNPTYSLTVKGNTEITGLTSFANPDDGTHRLEVAYYAQPTLRFLSGSAMPGTIEGQMGGLHLKSTATKAIEFNDNAAVFGSATNYYDVQLNKSNLGSTKVGTNIQFIPSTGIVSATSFRGDGSLLTGISASGTGGKFVANATGIHTLSSVGIGTTTATGAVNTGNTSVLNVGVVTANNFYGTFRGDGTNITGIAVTNVQTGGGDVKLESNASGVSITGIATATSFVGDGSGLTGIVGSGSGIVVKDSGSAVGTAGTINFGDGLSVTAIAGAAVTVSFTGDVNHWGENDTGIHTTGSVGIGTTNAQDVLCVDGNIKIVADGQQGSYPNGGNLWVSGVTTCLNGLVVNDIRMNDAQLIRMGDSAEFWIWHDAGGDSKIRSSGGQSLKLLSESTKLRNYSDTDSYLEAKLYQDTSLFHHGDKRLATSGVGVTVYGSSNLTGAKLDIKPGIGTFMGAAGIGITIDEWKLSDNYFRSAEYQLTVTNNTGGHVQSQKVLVMHDGSDNAFYSEWAVMYGAQGSRIVSVGATGSGGYVRLEVTPEPGYSGLNSYFFSRTAIG